jgi:sugar/nucleoside kinase (ribokinase family)
MERPFDVLTVGELNVDLILDRLAGAPQVGKEILAQGMTLTLGSSSAIFASNLRCLGPSVAFVGRVGADLFGDFVRGRLRDGGVDTSAILVSPDHPTGATVVLNQGEDRAMITHPGAMAHLTLDDLPAELLGSARHLHLSSLFLQPGLRPRASALFRRAREAGMTTSFDPQWDPSERWDLPLADLLPHVDVFLPNEAELLRLTGKRDVLSALTALRSFARTVVVKQGSRGATAQAGTEIVSRPAFSNPRVVDAIGAGDSFDAGFVSRFLKGDGLAECLTFGNLAGAVSTTAAGGTGAFGSLSSFMSTAKERFSHA